MNIDELRKKTEKVLEEKRKKEKEEQIDYKEKVRIEAEKIAERIIQEIPAKIKEAVGKGEFGIYAFYHLRSKNYCHDGDATIWNIALKARRLISEWCKKEGFAVETYERDLSANEEMTLWISWKK